MQYRSGVNVRTDGGTVYIGDGISNTGSRICTSCYANLLSEDYGLCDT